METQSMALPSESQYLRRPGASTPQWKRSDLTAPDDGSVHRRRMEIKVQDLIDTPEHSDVDASNDEGSEHERELSKRTPEASEVSVGNEEAERRQDLHQEDESDSDGDEDLALVAQEPSSAPNSELPDRQPTRGNESAEVRNEQLLQEDISEEADREIRDTSTPAEDFDAEEGPAEVQVTNGRIGRHSNRFTSDEQVFIIGLVNSDNSKRFNQAELARFIEPYLKGRHPTSGIRQYILKTMPSLNSQKARSLVRKGTTLPLSAALNALANFEPEAKGRRMYGKEEDEIILDWAAYLPEKLRGSIKWFQTLAQIDSRLNGRTGASLMNRFRKTLLPVHGRSLDDRAVNPQRLALWRAEIRAAGLESPRLNDPQRKQIEDDMFRDDLRAVHESPMYSDSIEDSDEGNIRAPSVQVESISDDRGQLSGASTKHQQLDNIDSHIPTESGRATNDMHEGTVIMSPESHDFVIFRESEEVFYSAQSEDHDSESEKSSRQSSRRKDRRTSFDRTQEPRVSNGGGLFTLEKRGMSPGAIGTSLGSTQNKRRKRVADIFAPSMPIPSSVRDDPERIYFGLNLNLKAAEGYKKMAEYVCEYFPGTTQTEALEAIASCYPDMQLVYDYFTGIFDSGEVPSYPGIWADGEDAILFEVLSKLDSEGPYDFSDESTRQRIADAVMLVQDASKMSLLSKHGLNVIIGRLMHLQTLAARSKFN
jgi:hypothetical protein